MSIVTATPIRYATIMIIDDDPIVLQLMTAYFSKQNASEILTAQNGAEALALLKSHPKFDLIVSDLHMPDFDGIEFMNELQATQNRVPLVIASSAKQAELKAAEMLAMAYGLNLIAAMSKPVNFDMLTAILTSTQSNAA